MVPEGESTYYPLSPYYPPYPPYPYPYPYYYSPPLKRETCRYRRRRRRYPLEQEQEHRSVVRVSTETARKGVEDLPIYVEGRLFPLEDRLPSSTP